MKKQTKAAVTAGRKKAAAKTSLKYRWAGLGAIWVVAAMSGTPAEAGCSAKPGHAPHPFQNPNPAPWNGQPMGVVCANTTPLGPFMCLGYATYDNTDGDGCIWT